MQRVRRWKWVDIARDESQAVDLLLTEVVMPRMNPPELARLLRGLRPELVAPFVTGWQTPEFSAQRRWTVRTSTFRSRSQCTANWPSP
jgi:hypothetical protein